MTSHADLRVSLVIIVCSLAGCSVSHDAPVRVYIKDSGVSYTICRGSLIVRRELSLAETTYELESDGLPDRFVESGVKRFTINKLDEVEPVTMPSAMPDPDVDLDGNGNRYREGTVYRWDGGLEAVIKQGEWKPVTLTRELPSCAREPAPTLPTVRKKAEPDIRRSESTKRSLSQWTDDELLGITTEAPKPIR